ncbi:MAG TPA: hypothetical protein P5521_01260 [Candidatus Omnitrophota bacterium]|nr:hypothetical protein [Candidatus Omnitrophota bacterium]HRZ66739.1 hypothetical protein [Candidatus Omnitrophota bacterium]
MPGSSRGTILFNPVSVVHYRNVSRFAGVLDGWKIRKIVNPAMPWFSKARTDGDDLRFEGGLLPRKAFDGISAVVVFSAQPRTASASLITDATVKGIPVIAVEEVLQMMLEQGYVNEYFLPVDRLYAGSSYEKKGFTDFGIPEESVEAAGNIFGNVDARDISAEKKEGVRSGLGIAPGRKVAVLSLAYQTPSGETLKIRRSLIEIVYRGLPEDYTLIVKPHPAEQDAAVRDFVKGCAPSAVTADRFTPIGDILAIADVLFNRGNSQVIIDAFNRKVPVIVVPAGRKTFFHGRLDALIADDEHAVKRALGLICREGFGIYDAVTSLYAGPSADDALRKAASGINEAASSRFIFERSQRLSDLAVYWAWMGYPSRATGVLRECGCVEYLPALTRLIGSKATYQDFEELRNGWATRNYRMWLLKSMKIRQAYFSGERLDDNQVKWLADYPPRMNREYFVDFACMLCRNLFDSGRVKESGELFDKIKEEYGYLKFTQRLESALGRGKAGWDFILWKICAVDGLKRAARDMLLNIRTAVRNI